MDAVTALDPARLAAALRATGTEVEKTGGHSITVQRFDELADRMESGLLPDEVVLAAVAALLRGLAPEPGNAALAKAEKRAQDFSDLWPGTLLAEVHRARAAETHERARAQNAIDESMRRGAQIAELQAQLAGLQAENHVMRETGDKIARATGCTPQHGTLADHVAALVADLDEQARSGPEQCCGEACRDGACESCRCCSAGWCVMGTDGVPGDDALPGWIEVAAQHNPIVTAWQADRAELARLRAKTGASS